MMPGVASVQVAVFDQVAAAVASAPLHARAEAAIPVVTPPTNSGVTVQWAGVHWASGTTYLALEVVHEMVQEFLGCVLTPMKRGNYFHDNGARGAGGVQVYWTAGRPDVLVVLPGEACEILGPGGVMTAIVALQLRVTRLDVAWDIEGLTVSRVAKAFQRGDVVGRVHRDSGRLMDDMKSGKTFYIGSRQSPRYLRFYDRRGPTRMEMEVKDARAQGLVALLQAHSEEDWSSVCIGHVRDFCDFRAREGVARPEDAPLLRWWGSVVRGAELVRIIIPGKRPTLEKMERWLKTSVAPSLALWIEASASPSRHTSRIGPGNHRSQEPEADLLASLVLDGRARWTARHHALLSSVQAVATA